MEKSKKRENSVDTEADSDVNVLGLTAQDLRDPGAIVSSRGFFLEMLSVVVSLWLTESLSSLPGYGIQRG